MHIHHTVWYFLIKTIVVVGLLYYSFGSSIAVWYLAASAAFYSLMAMNAVIQLELKLKSEDL
jgi:energy-converting hydrogenase Eha subunit E